MGVKEPEATFSACFGAAFMVWHPTKYAELLAAKIAQTGAQAWLVNTGWSGGGYGVGKRMSLRYTRAILDAIHDGSLAKAKTTTEKTFGFELPASCMNVPSELLDPKNTWADKTAFDAKLKDLAARFVKNFQKYQDQASDKIRAAAPRI
jgi:phosphoenolpyruvate carboxykinase (ATP)